MLTLDHGVEGVDGGQVGGDADVLVSAGRLQVHGDGPVHVAVEVGDHSRGEGDVGQAAFAVVAADRGGEGLGVKSETGFSYTCPCSPVRCTARGEGLSSRESGADGARHTKPVSHGNPPQRA